ncbi:MAG: PLP-dependent aspartate aminotransferase family protein [Armatimonadota bacterium]
MKTKTNNLSHETKAIHAGEHPDKLFGAVTTPIYQTSIFAFENAAEGAARFSGKNGGYKYTRLGNPTVKALEDKVAALEGAYCGIATSTGMAAVTTVYLTFLSSDSHILSTDSLYGPSRLVIEKYFSKFGVKYSYVDTSDIKNIEKNMRPDTKMIYIETPANPTMKLADIKKCAQIAHKHGAVLAVDNTFMSPVYQRPIELGADIVIHSMTKFLNGHSDVVAGMILTKNKNLADKIKPVLCHFGGTIDPTQAWLVLRGVKSLALRVEKAQENAIKLAKFLSRHPKIKWVKYPGLPSHPQYKLAKQQMSGSGSILCFELKGGISAGKKLLNNTNLCTLAVSLGGLETLIQHPASMTHAAVPKKAREESGITDGLIRLSVGCESCKDLENDLAQALKKA